ncbi:MAG: RidA/YER057c/UK114 superfamily, group 6, partial [uncultured Rubrobacteraceae bacterium]
GAQVQHLQRDGLGAGRGVLAGGAAGSVRVRLGDDGHRRQRRFRRRGRRAGADGAGAGQPEGRAGGGRGRTHGRGADQDLRRKHRRLGGRRQGPRRLLRVHTARHQHGRGAAPHSARDPRRDRGRGPDRDGVRGV